MLNGLSKPVGNNHGLLRAGKRRMFLAAEVRRDSRAHNDGAGPTLGSFMCMLSLPLRTSKSWIWSLHQPSIIATLSGIEYVSWGDLCTTLEATGRTTEAEARGPGGILAHVHSCMLPSIILSASVGGRSVTFYLLSLLSQWIFGLMVLPSSCVKDLYNA